MNLLERITSLINKGFIKKTRIILSSLVIFINCFFWKSSSNICFAQNKDNGLNSNSVSNHKYLGLETLNLDTWKKTSNFSWQNLQTYFKQTGNKSFNEINWKSNKTIYSNGSLLNLVTLIEKVSETKKCRINSKVQLEGIILTGVTSYFLENKFPQICSLDHLSDKTHDLLKTDGFNYGKLQNGNYLRPILNYFPNTKFLMDNFKKIPSDSGRGFLIAKFFSTKGSPFFEKILGSEYSTGYNVNLDSNAACQILTKTVNKNINEGNFSIKINKDAKIYKPESYQHSFGLKIPNFSSCPTIFYLTRKRYDMKSVLLDKNNLKKFDLYNQMNIASKNEDNIMRSNENQLNLSFSIKTDHFLNFTKIKTKIKENNFLNLQSFNSVFYKSINQKNRSILKKTLGNKDKINKIFHFEKFKKKKNISSLTSKDKNTKTVKLAQKNINKVWGNRGIYQTFNLNTLCFCFKTFHPQEIKVKNGHFFSFPVVYNSEKNKFLVKFLGDKKIAFQSIDDFTKIKINKNYIFSKENLVLNKSKPELNGINLELNARKEISFILLKTLKRTFNQKKALNWEIFNFSGTFDSTKTKDWKTYVSFLNKFKYYKNSKILNICATTVGYGYEIPKSIVESQKFHGKSAKIGNSNSLLNLAISLMKGTGVKKNKQSAFLVFSKTAHQGFSKGIYNTINMLRNGMGVKKDSLRALKILENSKNLIVNERKPFKKNRKVNRNGFFKSLFSNIRFPRENGLISFLLESYTSPLVSYLGTIIFERANMIASDINLTNISTKKGSLVCQKKLKELFLENRQQYLFQETSKGLPVSDSNALNEYILKWNLRICFINDPLLLGNLTKNSLINLNVFDYLKTFENNFLISVYRSSYYFFSLGIHFVNFFLRMPTLISFIFLKFFRIIKG